MREVDAVLCQAHQTHYPQLQAARLRFPWPGTVVICHAMSSNSVRVSADLFDQALRQGEVLSRSAAQQLEHWARLGAAVERSGLSVAELIEVLRGDLSCRERPASALWAAKRDQQARDISAVESGQASSGSMSWFSGGRARQAKAIDSPL
jgi:ParD-like antitoxin of type II bacterial toxin-antitoxin system